MNVFKSFFFGGYECADLINNRGNRVDLLKTTAHDTRTEEDYILLSGIGIKTVREGIRWSVVEKTPGVYDFSEVLQRIKAAQQQGMQQLWDICHFGYPDGLMPSHPQFTERFANMCAAFTRFYRHHTTEPLIITPINEISFISWLGGDARGTVPFAINSGFDVKYHLCRAAIKGVQAIKAIDPEALIMFVEPLIRVHPKKGEAECEAIKGFNEAQFQAMDIITGRMCPELGGRPEYMDFAGFNFYYNNQWEDCGPTIGWCTEHRRTCFSELLKDAADRYRVPVVLSETGHFLEDRGKWIKQITADCIKAMKAGVDLRGICIYPVLDRPDWDSFDYIHCGIWAYNENGERTTVTDYAADVQECVVQMEHYLKALAEPVKRGKQALAV
jgi:beta-glucosidase/6-phospho-beta-glucosidase/beta-galactosidase